jgi:adenylate cyclase
VRYVLEGSVRRSGNQLRINAQLIDAETGAHLWAERFDHDTGDLFAVQNEITSRIAIALSFELIAAEAIRPTEHPDALDYILRGRAAGLQARTRSFYEEAIGHFERALTLDPRSVEAQSRLATELVGRVMDNLTNSATADIERADELSRQALAASPRSPWAHLAKANVLRAQGRCEEAIPEYETVIAFNRNWANTISQLGQCKFLTGSPEEAIALVEQAIRLSPRDPIIANWYRRIGTIHLLQSRNEEAILWLEKSRSANAAAPSSHAWLASAYALKRDLERAAASLAEARRLSSDDRYSSIARLNTVGYSGAGYWGVAKIRALFETTYFVGLRLAGMPEE